MNKSHQLPLLYTGVTPAEKRREFIKFLHDETGLSVPEIAKIYPELPSGRIRSIINNRRGYRRIL